MKTLIFSGSPRENGNTAFCAHFLENNISGDVTTVDAHKENIRMCIDCRYCANSKICRINDNMRQILDYIMLSDRIIIISPLYFSTLTGELLALFSRTQFFYNTKTRLCGKTGILILIGGGSSKNIEPANLTGRVILKQLGCEKIKYLSYTDTDNLDVKNCGYFLKKLKDLCI